MLPHAMRIRSDTTITSGTIELVGRVQPTAAGSITHWLGPHRPTCRHERWQAV